MDDEFVIDHQTGEKLALYQDEIEGFRPGDRVKFAGACYPELLGCTGTILGYTIDSDKWGKIVWMKPDGMNERDALSTPVQFAGRDLQRMEGDEADPQNPFTRPPDWFDDLFNEGETFGHSA